MVSPWQQWFEHRGRLWVATLAANGNLLLGSNDSLDPHYFSNIPISPNLSESEVLKLVEATIDIWVGAPDTDAQVPESDIEDFIVHGLDNEV